MEGLVTLEINNRVASFQAILLLQNPYHLLFPFRGVLLSPTHLAQVLLVVARQLGVVLQRFRLVDQRIWELQEVLLHHVLCSDVGLVKGRLDRSRQTCLRSSILPRPGVDLARGCIHARLFSGHAFGWQQATVNGLRDLVRRPSPFQSDTLLEVPRAEVGSRRGGEVVAPWAAPAEEAATAISTPLPEWASVCWTLEVRLAEIDCRKPVAAGITGVDAAAERFS